MSKNNYTDDDIEIIYWGEDEEEENVEKVVDSAEKIPVEDKKSEPEEKFDLIKEIFSWLKVAVCAVVAAVFIEHVLIVNAEVPTGSMENTIMTDSRMIGWRWSYKFNSKPERRCHYI